MFGVERATHLDTSTIRYPSISAARARELQEKEAVKNAKILTQRQEDVYRHRIEKSEKKAIERFFEEEQEARTKVLKRESYGYVSASSSVAEDPLASTQPIRRIRTFFSKKTRNMAPARDTQVVNNLSDNSCVTMESPPRMVFSTSERFPDPPSEVCARPASYLDVSTESPTKRAFTPVGTFSTGQRSTLGSSQHSCKVAFYDPLPGIGAGKKSNVGIRTSAPRFQSLRDDSSPGPIYTSPSALSNKGVKLSSVARNLDLTKGATDYGQRVPPPVKVVDNPNRCQYGCCQRSHTTHCKFGKRLQSPGSTPTPESDSSQAVRQSQHDSVTKARMRVAEAHAIARAASRHDRDRKRDKRYVEITPGPGHFLKGTFVSDAPSFSVGRRLPPPRSTTPGPGAYNPQKFKPTAKPASTTFAKTAHDILQFAPCRDSPGPAQYGEGNYKAGVFAAPTPMWE